MSTTTVPAIGSRVKVIAAPEAFAYMLNKEGIVHDVREVGTQTRIVVDDDNGERHWFLPGELQALDGVQNLVADVAVYEVAVEAPLAWNAPTVPELGAWEIDVSPFEERLVADAMQKRAAEAVEHPTTHSAAVGKHDWVRVATSNPHIPFVGRVEKVLCDGRVIVRNGTVTYKTTMAKVTVLCSAEARGAAKETALTSTEVEISA